MSTNLKQLKYQIFKSSVLPNVRLKFKIIILIILFYHVYLEIIVIFYLEFITNEVL